MLGRRIMRPAARRAFAVGGGVFAPVLGAVRIGPMKAAQPLVHIARHVVHAFGRGAFGMDADRRGLVPALGEAGAAFIGRRGAPRISPLRHAARGELPLGLGRQPFAEADAIGEGAEPRGFDGRMALGARLGAPASGEKFELVIAIVGIEQVLPPRVHGARHRCADGVEEFGEIGIGDEIAVDLERSHGHAMGRPLVRRPVVAAHGERAAGQAHHVRHCLRGGGLGGESERQKRDRAHAPIIHTRPPASRRAVETRGALA